MKAFLRVMLGFVLLLAPAVFAGTGAPFTTQAVQGISTPQELSSLAAWYDVSDLSSMLNASAATPTNGQAVKLIADKSGNSAVNVLVSGGGSGNYATWPALTAFGTGDFTVSCDVTYAALSAGLFGGANNSFGLYIASATSKIVATKVNVADLAVSTTALSTLTRYKIAYTRSGTTGTYYVNGVADGAITDSNNYTVGVSLGGTATTALFFTNGSFGFMRVYSRALSASEVLADSTGTVQSGCVFNANYAVVSKLATSFTESSTNAATVTINTSGDTGARICGARDLVQMTASKQPILTIAAGANKLTYDGVDDYSKAGAFSLPQPASVYIVGTQETWTLNDFIFSGNISASPASAQAVGSPQFNLYGGGSSIGTIAPALTVRWVGSWIFNAASSALRLNRGTPVTGNGGSAAMNGFVLGAEPSPTQYGNITVNEVVIYSVAHSTSQQDSVIGYEARKWSISGGFAFLVPELHQEPIAPWRREDLIAA